MKQGKLLAVLGFLVVLALFLMTRPVREKACPLTNSAIASDPEFVFKCAALGGVVRDGKCTCRDGSSAT
jgi:hypothetical protein